MNPHVVRTLLTAVLATAAFCAQAQQTVKIAYIDPLSGAFANVGEQGLKQFQFVADDINRRSLAGPGVKLEIVPFDNKVSPQETLNVLKKVTDAGIRYVTQGNGSSVAGALLDAVQKHNDREPGKSIVYLNYAAVDPDFTNSKCSFWHFRFDANSDMKMEALTSYLAQDKSVKKVYLINQNYSFGQAVSRAAKELLARKRPDIQVAGDDLHPLGQVKDFSPYIAKIKQSGADTVITGNWGNDMALLVKAARDAALGAKFYTYYGGLLGGVPGMGDAAIGRVKQITEWHANVSPNKTEKFANDFKSKFKVDFYYLRVNTEMYMLAEAMKQAKSTDPLKVAHKLEGMKWTSDTGEVEMRAADHQLLNPLYISTIERAVTHAGKPQAGGDKAVKYEVENSGMGFKTDARIEAYVAAQPTSCQMKRP